MNDIDFSRSFIRWTSDRVQHSPRMQIDAACRIIEDGKARDYYLSTPCAGESMYGPKDLIQQPAYDFLMVFSPAGEFMFIKLRGDETRNLVEVHRVGETMSTNDGRGAPMLDMQAHVARLERVRELRAHGEIRESILGYRIITARTTIASSDGRSKAILDYPVKCCNVLHSDERWQVDAGPVLLPDVRQNPPWSIAAMRSGYIVFNQWNWAEAALRRANPGEDANPGSVFSRTLRLDVENHLYTAD